MFEIGIITKPQGIRGEMRVLPTTDDPTRFSLLLGEEVFINNTPYTLTGARQQKGIVIIKLDGLNDRTMVESLVENKIYIPEEKALPLGENEYYIRDLIGLRVQTFENENMEKKEIGVISRVFNTNANDVYVIEALEGDNFMIPAIKDVVLSVDMVNKMVTIRLMDGLRELKI